MIGKKNFGFLLMRKSLVRYDLNLTLRCHRFNYLAPLPVLDPIYLSVACGIVLLYAPLEYNISYHIIYLHFSQGYQWIKCSLGYGVDFVVRQDSRKKNTCLYI